MHFYVCISNKCTHSRCSLPCYFTDADAPVYLAPAKDLSEVKSQSVPSVAAVKQDLLLPPEGAVTTDDGEAETGKLSKNNLTEDKEIEVMDANEEGAQTEGKNSPFIFQRIKHIRPMSTYDSYLFSFPACQM